MRAIKKVLVSQFAWFGHHDDAILQRSEAKKTFQLGRSRAALQKLRGYPRRCRRQKRALPDLDNVLLGEPRANLVEFGRHAGVCNRSEPSSDSLGRGQSAKERVRPQRACQLFEVVWIHCVPLQMQLMCARRNPDLSRHFAHGEMISGSCISVQYPRGWYFFGGSCPEIALWIIGRSCRDAPETVRGRKLAHVPRRYRLREVEQDRLGRLKVATTSQLDDMCRSPRDASESRLRARAAGSHLNSPSKTERKCGNPALASASGVALE